MDRHATAVWSGNLKEGKGALEKLAADQAEVCRIANPQSLEMSLLITASLYALGGLFFFWCCRYLNKDMVTKVGA